MIQYSSINDAWGNKEMYKKNTINNIDGFANKLFTNEPPKQIDTFIQQLPKVETFVSQQLPKVETFNDVLSTSTMSSPCSFAEHLKSCDHCRNSLLEYFDNGNSVSTINIFGLKINITKAVLKIIFVIIIVLIFIIILSTINISLKDTSSHMKYYIMPQVSNIPMNNIPFYH